ncbi:MAG: hypothetical protein ACNA8W_13275, partial [Bradymonadaceae bacterium]
ISDPVETQFGYHLIEVLEQEVEEDEIIRIRARHILLRVTPSEATREAIFELLLTHDNQRVRRAAFGRLGAMGDELLPLFRKLVIDAKTPVDIRGDLVVLLATSRDEADKPLFEGLVSKEASNAIGHRAAWALTQYGDAGLEEAFRAHLATDNPTLRAIAVYGLSRMN